MSFALDERQRRDLWGLTLIALTLLLVLSLVPPAALGASALFPTGNIVGVVGRAVAAAAWRTLGVATFLLPVFPGLWSAVAFRLLDAQRALRWTVLLGVLGLLLPATVFALARPFAVVPPAAGWLGQALGAVLTLAFGWFGALLVLGFAFAAAAVATLAWNPLRAARNRGVAAWRHTRALGAALPVRGSAAVASLADEPAALQLGTPDDVSPPPANDAEETAEPSESGTLWVAPAAAPATRPASPASAVSEAMLEDPGDLSATNLPPTGMLTAAPPRDVARNRRELSSLGQVLIDKLATFRIQGEIVGTTTGPVVTQFEVAPAPGVKVSRIASLDADLALALRAPSVRIIAPIPGKGAVGVEVPNPEPEMVYFREVIEAAAFRSSKAHLPLALGKDIAGQPYIADLAKMPHLLIAGATGSGKSVCVNTIITSLIFRHSPQSLRLLMVDPKMVELSMYNDLPHLRHPVVTDNNDAAGVLKWAVLEMERRYALLSANGVRNLQDFNKRLEAGHTMRTPETDAEEGDPDRWIYDGGALPYIVLIIDELADLMMTVQGDVEKPLALLAQKARAIGIHLILATQRPSVNVITGLIKANFPSRIAFRVSSKTDSRTILDQNGADALLGNGDMLLLPPASSEPVRMQGAFLSTEETEQLMAWYREQARQRREEALRQGRDPDEPTAGEADILDVVRAAEGAGDADVGDELLDDRDKLFREAAELCIQHQGGSTSLLQRRLRIGYGRAARIIDQLHHAGVLGPPDGSKPREVLLDLVQLEQFYPDG